MKPFSIKMQTYIPKKDVSFYIRYPEDHGMCSNYLYLFRNSFIAAMKNARGYEVEDFSKTANLSHNGTFSFLKQRAK